MDERYNYKIPSKGGAWALLILASIIALVDVYFWLPFYRACQANGHNVVAAIQANMTQFALFAGLFAVFFLFSVFANIKFSKCKRFWGPGFGIFLGRFTILLEYAAYAFAVIALFIA